MKKKVFIAMMATTLLLAGCSSNTTNSEVKDEQTKVEAQEDKYKTSEVESEEPASETETTDDVKFADMIPDPKDIFANGQMSIITPDGGDSYSFRINGFTADEGEKYIEECKNLGFTYEQMDTTNSDGVRSIRFFTEDKKYSVYVCTNVDKGYVDVVCEKSDQELIDRLSK